MGLAAKLLADQQREQCPFQPATSPAPLVSAELCSAWGRTATQRKPPVGVFLQNAYKYSLGCPQSVCMNTPQSLVASQATRSESQACKYLQPKKSPLG